MDIARKKRLGYLEGILSTVINTILAGFKLWVGMAAGSVAMVADAWHTFSDTLTSMVVILGFWISSKPKDDKHPFGHGRAELIGSVIIGTLLAVVGANFLKESWMQLVRRETVDYSPAAIIVFSVSVLAKEALARFSIWAGRKTRSQSLIADGWHHRSDALASAMIIAGAVFGGRLWWMDGLLGLGVSLLILWAAFQVIREAANGLMGSALDAGTEAAVKAAVAEAAPGLKPPHHVHAHVYGDHVEMTFHLRFPAETPVIVAHDACSRVEQVLRDRLGLEATVHSEPVR
jgi:cation diffusion facilitator family transporter